MRRNRAERSVNAVMPGPTFSSIYICIYIYGAGRYCSFVDNVSYIVNESIRPDLIVGAGIKRREGACYRRASSVGTSRARPTEESEMCQRPASCVAADDNRTGLYATKNCFSAVSFLGCSVPRDFADMCARART